MWMGSLFTRYGEGLYIGTSVYCVCAWVLHMLGITKVFAFVEVFIVLCAYGFVIL